ncbi:peptidase S10, serine carboxypeptidase [Exidia glandulosa HHB12029]|uniref:Carboxypeptidase n=1 Tax=Exidia glandulosa HHB12029 TaxID=1314781 RepID=A0A165HNN8_EXIGL|nr:peptidase S10, serine carboxypeptidase [Exidia glandulosa HHB12029]
MMWSLGRALVVVGAALSSSAQQAFFQEGFPAPEQQLSALSTEEFSTFTHASFPNHRVRIKRLEDFCDTTGVKSYSGYIDVEARHLFFYFFESRNKPEEDPVLLWTNGGPGCSSTTGLFLELGPCRLEDEEGPKHNPYSWNANASVFFIDQPIGVGYSYADHGEAVTTTEQGAVDVAAFVSIFFETFDSFAGRDFHLTGESYAGRYLPVYAAAIVDANAKAAAEGRKTVNLKSVVIGNGSSDRLTQALSSYDILCTNTTGLGTFLPISTCVRMRNAMPRCKTWFTESCLDMYDAMSCEAAASFCRTELSYGPFSLLGGLNRYDLSQQCDDPGCGITKTALIDFLNDADVRKTLGVDRKVGNFTGCAPDVGSAFNQAGDMYHSSRVYIEELLERGIRILQFAGTYDWVCNWVGVLNNAHAMQWTGAKAFNSQEMREWQVDGARAGLVKSAKGLTFATVEGAGHLVPSAKPVEALAMINRWIADKEL